jgi:hypothetical protein
MDLYYVGVTYVRTQSEPQDGVGVELPTAVTIKSIILQMQQHVLQRKPNVSWTKRKSCEKPAQPGGNCLAYLSTLRLVAICSSETSGYH